MSSTDEMLFEGESGCAMSERGEYYSIRLVSNA